MNDDPGRELAIFTEAIKVPPQDRTAFLRRACCGDDHLRRKLEALLSASERSGDFLEKPAIPSALASVLRQRANPANRKGRQKPQTGFQYSRRKRKGE